MALFNKTPKDEPEQDPVERRHAEIGDLMSKYSQKLDGELGAPKEDTPEKGIASTEYQEFKAEYTPKRLNLYEKLCNFSEKLIKISPDPRKVEDYKEAIEICHLNITPGGTVSFSILFPLIFVFLGTLFSYLLLQSTFFILFFLIIGLAVILPLQRLPLIIANNLRLKASNQMVLCIFYVVTYMRHTSNLERAVEFASDHLAAPLSLDLKKVLWNVETGKYESLKESLDHYLDSWRKYNLEFIEAFHLVESSLYEGDEDRRVTLLDKALNTILEETYEKMLHYAQNLKSPITMLHMLGIILPILGLVILPLIVSFMCSVQWYHLMALYNVALPVGIYLLGKNILASRPTGYGDTDIAEDNPELRKYRNILFRIAGQDIQIQPMFLSIAVGVIFLLIGLSPLLLHAANPGWDVIYDGKAGTLRQITTTTDQDATYSFLEYRQSKGCPPGEGDLNSLVGPFGLGAAILSIVFVLGISMSMGLYYQLRAQNVIKIREKAKALEAEFASALFQLGNRIGDGIPAEIAFSKVAETMAGSTSGAFFNLVASNISSLGMGINDAIFDREHGALLSYPSSVIESSMKVLVESAKKGPLIAANALLNVARYIKEIHRVDERLKDLLADIISSMTSQIKFLTPAISGIVIGLTSMITTILGKLGGQLQQATVTTTPGAASANAQDITTLFGDGVPTYFFQLSVGLYVVQIIYILTVLVNGISNGADKLNERYTLGQNLIKSTLTYIITALAVMLMFNLIAGNILSGIGRV